MAEEGMSRMYALALFRVARHKGQVKEWGESLYILRDILEHSRDLKIFLSAPNVDSNSKAKVIQRLSALGKLTPEMENFLRILVRRRKTGLIHLIAENYADFADFLFNQIDVLVQSAVPLKGEEKERLEKVMGIFLKKRVRVTYEIVPDLIAGMIISAGGKVYNSSLLGQLKRMRLQMIQ